MDADAQEDIFARGCGVTVHVGYSLYNSKETMLHCILQTTHKLVRHCRVWLCEGATCVHAMCVGWINLIAQSANQVSLVCV